MEENRSTLVALEDLCTSKHLEYTTVADPWTAIPPSTSVVFIRNFTAAQKSYLLHAAVLLLYTPSNEHFGIVPLEAMAAGLPVLAVDSGGPKESIIDSDEGRTGYLRDPNTDDWAAVIQSLIGMTNGQRQEIGEQGKQRVADQFSLEKLGEELEGACRDVLAKGNIQEHLAAALMWAGAGLMAFAAFNLGVLYWLYGPFAMS